MNSSERAVWMRKKSLVAFIIMWIPFTIFMVFFVSSMVTGSIWEDLPPMDEWPSGPFGGFVFVWERFSPPAQAGLVGIAVFFSLTMILFLGSFFFRGRARSAIRRRGLPGQAEIIGAENTRVTVNEEPLYRFTLQVQPSVGPKFEAQAERVVTRLESSHFQIGATVPVKYLPETQEVMMVGQRMREEG